MIIFIYGSVPSLAWNPWWWKSNCCTEELEFHFQRVQTRSRLDVNMTITIIHLKPMLVIKQCDRSRMRIKHHITEQNSAGIHIHFHTFAAYHSVHLLQSRFCWSWSKYIFLCSRRVWCYILIQIKIRWLNCLSVIFTSTSSSKFIPIVQLSNWWSISKSFGSFKNVARCRKIKLRK